MKAKEVETSLLEMILNREQGLLTILTESEQILKSQWTRSKELSNVSILPILQKLTLKYLRIEFETWESQGQKRFKGNPEHYWLAKLYAVDLERYLSEIETTNLTLSIQCLKHTLQNMDIYLESLSQSDMDLGTNSLGELIILHSKLKLENQRLFETVTDEILPQESLVAEIEYLDVEIENIQAAGELKIFDIFVCNNKENYTEHIFNPPSSIFLQGFKMVDKVRNINQQMIQVCDEIRQEFVFFKSEILRLIDEDPFNFDEKIDVIHKQIAVKIALLSGEQVEHHS